jgi:DNA-binding HxlR family transcriptional regulator
MLERIADKWTLLVTDALDSRKTMRFSRLRERLGGVSQKMTAA